MLASRARFSYGVDGDALVRRIGEFHTREEIAVTIANALRGGRNVNEASIQRKFRRFAAAAGSLVLLALAGAALFAVGAVK